MNKRTILIVEDDIELGTLTAEILEDEGYETDIVTDGALVYNRIVNLHPHLVLLDLHLPNLSGIEIVHQIRANSDLSNVKILLVTADIDLAKTLTSQVNAVFQKPYSIREMVEVVSRLH